MANKKVIGILAGAGAVAAAAAAVSMARKGKADPLPAEDKTDPDTGTDEYNDECSCADCLEDDFEDDDVALADDIANDKTGESDKNSSAEDRIRALEQQINTLKEALRAEKDKNARLFVEINTVLPMEKMAKAVKDIPPAQASEPEAADDAPNNKKTD